MLLVLFFIAVIQYNDFMKMGLCSVYQGFKLIILMEYALFSEITMNPYNCVNVYTFFCHCCETRRKENKTRNISLDTSYYL